jgi:predicted sulfurtransferase
MTYVDDDDFDDIDELDDEEELGKNDPGRCEECGLKVKKKEAITCPMCTAVYHEWCATECNRCKTPLKED